MADFMLHFLIDNLLIGGIIGMLWIVKRVFRNHLTARIQYNLWFPLLGLLAVPFLPLRNLRESQLFLWIGGCFDRLKHNTSTAEAFLQTRTGLHSADAMNSINDFALSVSGKMPSMMVLALWGIWIAGILAGTLFLIRSGVLLNAMKQSALPLQNPRVRMLYHQCLREMELRTPVPVYSTAYLKSPVIAGLLKPCIYLPISLISDCPDPEMRHIFLHELQHFRHRDALVIHLINLTRILYWFNPLVRYALREMRCEQEIACDASVLGFLGENDRRAYGNTLLNLAEKISLAPFPFAAGISGNIGQMQRRIARISRYQKPSAGKTATGVIFFCLVTVALFDLSPMLSANAAEGDRYRWNLSSNRLSQVDLSAYFGGYEGCFVLYDEQQDTWFVYNMEQSTLRTAPDSTYKIYDALFGLEGGIITPADNQLSWDQVSYPFAAWNCDQDLGSAMQSSVNWYFQEIDQQLGTSAVRHCLREIGYGNENMGTDLSSYWMQSSLKISPVEQVEILRKLYNNELAFSQENIETLKASICLFPPIMEHSTARPEPDA